MTQYAGGYPDIKGFCLLHPAFYLYKKSKEDNEQLTSDLQVLKEFIKQL
jgi:uracil-DNA glycosylase